MTKLIFVAAFLFGAAAVVLMGANFLGADTLALVVTVIIGGVYAIGAAELVQFRRATAALSRSLDTLSEEAVQRLPQLRDWLVRLPPSLQHAVGQRIEGDRVALPGPVLTPYLVSLLVMLGLLGTFVGLVVTLKGVVVALEGSSDLETIRAALTAPMGGLELAFGTSVAGVAASAMLGLMSTLSRHERTLATRHLDGKADTLLRRFSRAHQQQQTFEALQRQSQSLPAIADQLGQMAGQMQQMTERLGEQLLRGQERFQEGVRESYGELAATVDRSLRESIDKSDRLMAESGRLLGEGLQPIVREAMNSISAEVNQGVQATHAQLGQTVQDQLEALAGAFGQTTATVAQAWQEGVAAHAQSSAGLVREMRESSALFAKHFGAASAQVVQELRQTTAEWSERQAVAQEEQRKDWLEAQQRAGREISAGLAQAAAGIISELQAAAESQQAVSQRMLAETGELLASSEALVERRVETEKAWLEGQDQRVEQFTAGLRGELAALRDEEARRGQAALEQLQQLESTVADNLATLGRALEEPMTRLIELASETPRVAAEVIGKLRQQVSDSTERDNELLQERSRLLTELDAVSDSLSHASAGQLEAVERLVDSSAETLHAIGERFASQVADETSRASGLADQLSVGMAEIGALGEAFRAAVDIFGDSNRQLVESLQHIEGQLEKSASRSDEQLGYYVAQAREVIDYSVQAQREIFDELRQLRSDSSAEYEAVGAN